MATQKLKHSHPAPIHLSGVDPVMARIVEQVGVYDATYRRERFPALARAIIFQQLAGSSARAILSRFIELFPGRRFPSPEQVVVTSACRGCARSGCRLKPKALLHQRASRRCGREEGELPSLPENGGRRNHRGADAGEGHRAVDRRDVPDVQPRQARRDVPAGDLGGANRGNESAYGLAKRADAQRNCASSPSDGSRIARRRHGTCGGASRSCCRMDACERRRKKKEATAPHRKTKRDP